MLLLLLFFCYLVFSKYSTSCLALALAELLFVLCACRFEILTFFMYIFVISPFICLSFMIFLTILGLAFSYFSYIKASLVT